MFTKILIANRGEIACRVIRTCRRLGIATAAVHSDADADALHVKMADESHRLGPAAPAESYLAIERVVEAVRASGAEAVHPGFGFLAENAAFVEAVEAAGAVFIGPPARAVAAMGDKIESKRLARAAGVSVVPGTAEAVGDAAGALEAVCGIGYPVIIKPAAGGGGKGMRVARSDGELVDGFRASRSEAATSFGDSTVFIERFIENPRHIEIQLLADNHGNVLSLGERECSIQRRHQKVIEEAPSPLMDAATRESMGREAAALARAVNYRSAGTVEFVADQERNFYFLEMNTRLQVEHPVTEFVTGLDLVEQMIRIAAGGKLDPGDVAVDGWSIEARIYAEDPLRGFLPSIGRLRTYRPPPPSPAIRIDSGVEEGSEVTMFYDPMIAKLVVHGPDRGAAVAAMRQSLDGFAIRGVAHNIGFLAAIMRNPRFARGELSTAFIEETWPDGFAGADLGPREETVLAGTALLVHLTQLARHPLPPARDWVVALDGRQIEARARLTADGLDLEIGQSHTAIKGSWRPGETVFRGTVADEEAIVQVERQGTRMHLTHAGVTTPARVLTRTAATLLARMPQKPRADLSHRVLSPMPGRIVAVQVVEGEPVEAGQTLVIIDAMKMENALKAERPGTIASIHVAPGDSVSADQPLLDFET